MKLLCQATQKYLFLYTMIRAFSQILGTPVVGHEDGALLAMIRDIIIHPDTGKIEGFWIKSLSLPVNNAILLSDSILEWKKNIYIKDVREIADADDVIKISEILSRQTDFIGNLVVNESGKNVGQVYDLDFDTNKLYLMNIYTHKSILGIYKYDPRAFSFDSIIQVLPEYILVKDIEDKKIKVKEELLADDKQPILDV